jgi:KaiC/GvpD/RAD55 family RecA-like ATPase
MNAKAAAILSNPQPCGHIVYPYTDESQVAEAVCLFASAGLQKGEAVLLVMTEAHFEPILERIRRAGFDVNALTESGQLICEKAEELLSSFMFDGIIDEDVFKSKIGGMIERAKAAAGRRPVRVFGEMVSLIWQSKLQATERLEELWNEVIEEQSVPLLCAYALAGTKPDTLPESLLACHSHALI